MASLDDEFARFEAEIQSLEQQHAAPASTTEIHDEADQQASKKRSREEADSEIDILSKKPALESAKSIKPAVTTVISSAPKVYMAPPRPAPVKKAYIDPPVPESPQLRNGIPNTIAAVEAHRGALSGFPAGTSGEQAATISTTNSHSNANTFRQSVQRVDMVTGQVLSAEEQHMMNLQQSVYEYDPNKKISSTSGSQHNGPGASNQQKHNGKPKRNLRLAGGEIWEDPTLADWPENDFRLFCGDLGNEVSDELLAHSFSRYPSFQRARVVRDKMTHKSRGYGFVSFADPFDCAKALREMNGKYIGNRPVKISKSKWHERNLDVAKKKMKKKKRDKLHLFN